MALDLSGLASYTDEQKNDLIRASLLEAKTISMITVQPGIKSSAAINILSSSSVWQTGSCGFSNDGTTSLTQRVITVSDIKKNESICLNDLENFYVQSKMKAGSYNEEIPFAELYSEEVVGQTQKFIEELTWQGDTSLPGNNLGLADGLLKVIDGATAVVGSTEAALDASNIIEEVDNMVTAIPADMVSSEDLVLFMGYDLYRVYARALRDANLYAYSGAEGANFEQMVPGTNVKVVAVGGLVTTDRMILAEASNLHCGTDLLSDLENFSIFYSQDNDEVRVIQKMKIGFQVAFPNRIVKNTL